MLHIKGRSRVAVKQALCGWQPVVVTVSMYDVWVHLRLPISVLTRPEDDADSPCAMLLLRFVAGAVAAVFVVAVAASP